MIDTRRALLDATRICIGRHGLPATTARAITAEAGANLAAITYHFGTKDVLVAEALLEDLRDWLSPALAVLGGDGDPAARAMVTVRTLTDTFAAHREHAPTHLQALAQAPLVDSLGDGLRDLWRELRTQLARDIRALVEAGQLGAWVDPDTMAASLVAVALGLVVHVTVDPDGPALEAMAAQVGALLLSAREAHPSDI